MCEVCGDPIVDRKPGAKTCSDACLHERRKVRARAYAKAKYVPGEFIGRVVGECVHCGAPYPKLHKGDKYCGRKCQQNARTARLAASKPPPSCYKCGVEIEGRRRTGRMVCDDCRVDPRIRTDKHERRRRLRTYNITQEQYDSLFAYQGGSCAVCRTQMPGGRGWAIDHDHRCCPGFGSCGKCVRGILCSHCNMGIGQLSDEPTRLRAAAAYIESRSTIRIIDRMNREEVTG